jgi:hypothetical protein
MCCKLLGIGDTFRGERFHKPAHTWCPHCAVGKGCKVYDERPKPCKEFECLWLTGVLRGENLPPELRPDRCHVIFAPTTDETDIAVHVDFHRPDAWKSKIVKSWIEGIALAGFRLTVSSDNATEKIVIYADPKEMGRKRRVHVTRRRFTPPDANGMQFHIPGFEGDVKGWY